MPAKPTSTVSFWVSPNWEIPFGPNSQSFETELAAKLVAHTESTRHARKYNVHRLELVYSVDPKDR